MRASSDIGLMVPEVHLFHSSEKFERFCDRELGGTELLDSDGQMTYCDGIAAVKMTHRGSRETELSLLVHEAYHAAVAHMEWLGEDDAGEETMAYLLQTITNGLFSAHERWSRRKGR